jgi:ATP-dependent helicase Lhr and Lhr-like helicase
MGAVDLVVLVESPGAVSRGLQRIGRAGHGVGEVSIGRIFPKHRGDLLEATVVARRMREGAIEALRVPRNPLDVLAQHIVAMTAVQDWTVAELAGLVRRSANFHALPDDALRGVLDMLSGLYPSHDFADLRPRLTWDREHDVLQGRRSARMLAAVNAGTIPDRGLYGVFLGDDGPRIGELDEEMVHEITAGQTFTLGATTWRIQRINRNRVIVEPAPGEPGRLPFWKGEGPGRPLELGQALGAATRTLASMKREAATAQLCDEYGLDERAARNLLDYLDEQRTATGTLPTDRDITVERFRDELGDWRVCILTPFGSRVHAPWALALRAIVSDRVGYDVQAVWSDDGIVLTIADGDEPPDAALLVPDADEVEERLLLELPRSPIFAAEFRENAARALLLPRRRPGQRTPLFAQRLRAQKLMAIALEYPSFPMVVETFRSCLQDVFDVPALREVLRGVESGEIRVHDVETASASPFARSLVFAYVAAYLYEGDSPAAERRAQALAVDIRLLRELLGEADLRELLDAEIIEEVEAALQRKAEGRRLRHADDLHDALRQLGDLSAAEIAERADVDAGAVAEGARVGRRAVRVCALPGGTRGSRSRTLRSTATRSAPRRPPVIAGGVPRAVERPVEALLCAGRARTARSRRPMSRRASAWCRAGGCAARATGGGGATAARRVPAGRQRAASGASRTCCGRSSGARSRSCAARSRRCPREVLGRFLPAWHRVAASDPHERLEDAIVQLEGMPLSYRDLVRMILPARVRTFRPEHCSMSWAPWAGWCGPATRRCAADDGRVMLYRRERVDRLLIPPDEDEAVAAIEASTSGTAPSSSISTGAARPSTRSWSARCLHERGCRARGRVGPRLGRPRHERHVRGAALPRRAASSFARRRRAGTSAALPDAGMCGGTAAASGPGWSSGRASAVREAPLPRGWWREAARGRRREGRSRGAAHRRAAGRSCATSCATPVSSTERAHSWAATLLDRHAHRRPGDRGRRSARRRLRRHLQRAPLHGGRGPAATRLLRRRTRRRAVRLSRHRRPAAPRTRRAPTGTAVALAATDPANPYGWLLPWPDLAGTKMAHARRAARAPRAPVVVLVDGIPVLYLDRDGRRLRTFADAAMTRHRARAAGTARCRARPAGPRAHPRADRRDPPSARRSRRCCARPDSSRTTGTCGCARRHARRRYRPPHRAPCCAANCRAARSRASSCATAATSPSSPAASRRIEARGKHLLVHIEGGWTLRVHLGMKGWVRRHVRERCRARRRRCSWRMRRHSSASARTRRSCCARARCARTPASAGSAPTSSPSRPTSPKPCGAHACPRHAGARSATCCSTSGSPPASATSTRARCCSSAACTRARGCGTCRCGAQVEALFVKAAQLMRLNLLTRRRTAVPLRRRPTPSSQRLWVYMRNGKPCLDCGTPSSASCRAT